MGTPSTISVFIGEPKSIDPCHGSEHDGALVLRFLCDPLVDFTPDRGIPRPAAAERWELDDDGRGVRFFLRRGVRFHHGREVTAEDYVYSLNRAVSPAQKSGLAYHLSKIEGFDAVQSGAAQELAGVQAAGPYELAVRLSEPFAEVPTLFGHRVTAPVPRELAETDPGRFREMPVSNGPYRMSGPWEHGRAVRLTRFDGYYAGNEAFLDGGAGAVDVLEFRVYEELEHAYQEWRDGRLDVTKVPPVRIGEAMAFGERFRRTPCALMQYLGFPTRTAPFDDVRVRHAVALALDRQAIIDSAFFGTRPIATGVLPPALGAAHRPAASPLLAGPPDVERARRLLREAGVPETLVVPFYFNAGLGHEAWVQQVREQLSERLGIELDLRPLIWTEFLAHLKRGVDGMFRMTWAIDYPSADNFLFPLFHSDAVGSDNFSFYSDPRFDALLSKARATVDPQARIAAYQEAETLACEAMPILPLWFGVQYHVVALDRFDFAGPSVVDIFGEPVLRHARVRVQAATV
jgi:ABC-type oligopeptide transport system substrate-binding subunit